MTDTFGTMLRRWRTTRRLSQEALAGDAEISTRHLSCLETSKAKPSREMVLLLSSALELELRERNVLLTAAGFAQVYASEGLESLRMAPVRRAVELLLAQQEPWGAVLVDRTWNVLQVNDGARRLFAHFTPRAPMDNVVRAVLHPEGLRPFITNWVEVAAFTMQRLRQECLRQPHDTARAGLLDEVSRLPGIDALPTALVGTAPSSEVHLKNGDVELRLLTLLTTIGTPLDVTAEELAIESYFPADDASEAWLRGLVC